MAVSFFKNSKPFIRMMCLLTRNEGGQLSLGVHTGENIPSYIYFSHKQSLEPWFYETTGIQIEAFCGYPLYGFNVEDRTAWAENREIIGEEIEKEKEAAYCLLGNCGVQMQAGHGEGK
jgi:hypothetical protein